MRENYTRFFKKCLKGVLPYGMVALWRKVKEENRPVPPAPPQDVEALALRERLGKLYQLRAKNMQNTRNAVMTDYFLREGPDGEKYFDFCGAKLPDVRHDAEYMDILWAIFSDTFFIPYFLQDAYPAETVRLLDVFMTEGPYAYEDARINFDVTVRPGDVVIDAGAWVGDFSAYAASRGARVYAFEPSVKTFHWLERTARLNSPGEIHAFNAALADSCGEMELFPGCDTGNRHLPRPGRDEGGVAPETISAITLDEFVRQQGLERVDFIKADIEGAERRLLAGATETLRTFAPKLVLCTYHLPDDPEVLEQMILDINPNYKVVQLLNKVFACVPKAGA